MIATNYNVWVPKKNHLPADRRFVVARDISSKGHKRYIACDSYESMVQLISELVCAYEVINKMSDAVWLFIDTDRKDTKYPDTAVGKALTDVLLRSLAIEGITGSMDPASQLRVAYSSTASKTSLHLKMFVLFEDVHALKAFIGRLRTRIYEENIPELLYPGDDGKIECVVDPGVYNKFRCYRLVGMHKLGRPNAVLKCPDNFGSEEHFANVFPQHADRAWAIVPALGPQVKTRCGKVQRGRVAVIEETMALDTPPGADPTPLLDKYTDYINSFKCLIDILGAPVKVTRITVPAHKIIVCSIAKDPRHICPHAKRCHAGNNLFMVIDEARKTITIRCHDEDCFDCKGVSIIARDRDSEETTIHDQVRYDTMHAQADNIQWAEIYDEPCMQDYPVDQQIVCVRAGMGVGKTRALRRLASQFDQRSKALIVTYSCALAGKLYSEFAEYGFIDYRSVEGKIIDAKVIVCVDSIHRVSTCRFDYIFIDEAVSLFLHFNSPLMGSKTSINLAILELSILQAKHVFFLDACMDHTFGKNVVDYFADQKGVLPYWIWNRHVRPTNRKAFFDIVPIEGANAVTQLSQITRAINTIMSKLHAGKNVVVCSSSKSFTVRLQNYVSERRPQTKMLVYNSDRTDNAERLDNVTELWPTCQLLVYSPSITAGVSFESVHFDCLVAFMSNSRHAPTVDMSMQQLFRVRNLTDGDMHLFLHEMDVEDGVDFPLSREGIVSQLQSDLSLASKYFQMYKVNVPCVFRPSEDYVLEYDVERLSFTVIVGVVMMRNRSTVHFSDIMIDVLEEDYGIECTPAGTGQYFRNIVDIDLLRSSPSKGPPPDWSDILQYLDGTRDLSKSSLKPPPALIAARALVDFRDIRYVLPCDLDMETMQKFYNEVVSKDNAIEQHHRTMRFIKMCESSQDRGSINETFALAMADIIDSKDPNVIYFKTNKTTYNLKLVLGHKFVDKLLTPYQFDTLKSLEKVETQADKCLATYKALVDSLPPNEAAELSKLFDIKSDCGYTCARKIMSGAFGLKVTRKDRTPTRPGYNVIGIPHAFLLDIKNKYGANPWQKPSDLKISECLFRHRSYEND